jgi:RNA polymerase sigma-70 factor (ECF subfamily)
MSATAPLLFPANAANLHCAAAGDHDAFGAIIREHQDMVFSIAWHFLHDRDRAEEIAQEVFLQLYRTLGEIESNAHLTFWLRRVTANRCIDESRRGRWRIVTLDEASDVARHSDDTDPLLTRKVGQMLQRLPAQQRLAITMRYQEGLEPSEIGMVLDMPLNTVKSHLRRGLAALREWLGVTR